MNNYQAEQGVAPEKEDKMCTGEKERVINIIKDIIFLRRKKEGKGGGRGVGGVLGEGEVENKMNVK